MRLRIDQWLERERIKPLIAGEFEDCALLMTFAAAGLGVFPAPISIKEEILETHKLEQIGSINEEFHLIYTARKVLHPFLLRLIN